MFDESLVTYAQMAYASRYGPHFRVITMSTVDTFKQERMHIRLDAAAKQKLERAAGYANKTLSEFVLSRALDAANEVIEEHETLRLDNSDWEVFLDALENPPEPNPRLRRAFVDHRKRVQR